MTSDASTYSLFATDVRRRSGSVSNSGEPHPPRRRRGGRPCPGRRSGRRTLGHALAACREDSVPAALRPRRHGLARACGRPFLADRATMPRRAASSEHARWMEAVSALDADERRQPDVRMAASSSCAMSSVRPIFGLPRVATMRSPTSNPTTGVAATAMRSCAARRWCAAALTSRRRRKRRRHSSSLRAVPRWGSVAPRVGHEQHGLGALD